MENIDEFGYGLGMPDAYAKWIVIAGIGHRPNPLGQSVTMCGERPGALARITSKPPRGVRHCLRCRELVRAARIIGQRAVLTDAVLPATRTEAVEPPTSLTAAQLRLMQELATERAARKKRQTAEIADRRSRGGTQSNSVRSVSGGLPGLGRRHR